MSRPLVVTPASFTAAFNESAFEGAAGRLSDLGNPVERAAFLAAYPTALDAVRVEGALVHEGLLFAPNYSLASRLMSAVADHAPAESRLEPLTAGGLEVQFATNDWWGWFRSVFDHVIRSHFHPLVRPTTTEPVVIPNHARIGILGDWGTGLYGAPVAGATIRAMPRLDLLVHLGDVYYSGTEKEVDDRFLAIWPYEAAVLHRAANSNHEMYSGGHAYFEKTLPRFGQESSYFAVANDHWLLLGLDSGYLDHDLDPEQVGWIRAMIDRAGDRRVICFSHHQLVSYFGTQGDRMAAHLGALLTDGRIAAWYWGHEHRCVVYQPDPRFGGLLGRCIGHSGMPERRGAAAELPAERTEAGVIWRRFPGTEGAPAGVVQDGENPYITGREKDYAPHGFAMLELTGPHLQETIHLPDGQVVHRQELF